MSQATLQFLLGEPNEKRQKHDAALKTCQMYYNKNTTKEFEHLFSCVFVFLMRWRFNFTQNDVTFILTSETYSSGSLFVLGHYGLVPHLLQHLLTLNCTRDMTKSASTRPSFSGIKKPAD